MKTGMDRERFFRGAGWDRAWQGQKSSGGVGQGSKSAVRGRAHNACNSWLKSYATAEETFICIALNEVSQMYSTFIIMIFDNDKSEGSTPQCNDDGVIDYLAMLDSKNS